MSAEPRETPCLACYRGLRCRTHTQIERELFELIDRATEPQLARLFAFKWSVPIRGVYGTAAGLFAPDL